MGERRKKTEHRSMLDSGIYCLSNCINCKKKKAQQIFLKTFKIVFNIFLVFFLLFYFDNRQDLFETINCLLPMKMNIDQLQFKERKRGSVLVELLHSSDATLKFVPCPLIHTNKHVKFNIFL